MAYKHDYDKTLTRLNTIIARLNDGDALSVNDLAKEFNVSTRTIQRDFNERLVSLYPIYQDKKRWKMQDGYKIEKSNSVEETIVLDILEKLTDGLGPTFSMKAKNLLSKIKNDDYNPIYAKLNMEDISNFHDIALLEDAIHKKVLTKCSYSLNEHKREIELKPLKIVSFEGFWYLIALDARNDILKKYHLKSISSIKLENETFTSSNELEEKLNNAINIWFDDTREPFEVLLWVNKDAAKIIKRKPISNNQRLEKEYQDGSIEISLKITHEMEIKSIVNYWLPHIKIISPQYIQESILKNMQGYIESF